MIQQFCPSIHQANMSTNDVDDGTDYYRSPDCSGVNPLELLHEHGTIPNPLHFLQHQRSNNDPLTVVE